MVSLFSQRQNNKCRAATGSGARLKVWLYRSLQGAVLFIFAGIIALTSIYFALEKTKSEIGPPPLQGISETSKTILDRNGRLLRAYTTRDGLWRLPVTHNEVDQKYLELLLAFEDQRFWSHTGVDPWAILRAAKQLLSNRRIVSGASTLTMQVARLVDRKHERTAGGKFRQMARALQLEQKLSKQEILNLYLRLAPFGGNIEGIRAASLAYFGKEPKRLSLAQAALLVALPQSPEARRPDRHWKKAKRARAHVLKYAVTTGLISEAEAQRANAEPMPKKRLQFPKFSAHLADAELAIAPKKNKHNLSIDRRVQSALETLAKQHAESLGPKLSAAIIVVENDTGEIIASVGSANYLDNSRLGAIDMTRAVRSPGSTLKPLVYGLGFEAGIIHPETLIEDRPTRFGMYAPKNFDKGYRGTITIRDALAQSLNIPAVKVLDVIGPARLVAKLRQQDTAAMLPAGSAPTLAVGLGGIGLTLRDLAKLYVGLARNGDTIALTHRRDDVKKNYLTGDIAQETQKKPLLRPVAASYVTDILKDAPPPPNAKRGQIAYKTGTSYGYRDALAVGYDGRHTIAVWVGRADGTSTPGLLGRTAAAPILFDAFTHLASKRTPLPDAPKTALRVAGHDLPQPLRRFHADQLHQANNGPFLKSNITIAFPPDRSELASIESEEGFEHVMLRAEGGQLPLTWLANGAPISSQPHNRHTLWQPDGQGFVKFTVIDSAGQVDRVTVRLK